MVIADSNRSFTVAMTTTPSGIRDIYWIHAELAGELAARARDVRTDELVEKLAGHAGAYSAALKSGVGGHAVLFSENWAFHSAIHRTADAPAIAVTLKNTLRYFPGFSYDIPGWNEAGAQRQTALLAEFTRRPSVPTPPFGPRPGTQEAPRSTDATL
jgi:DNA-binding GntR family transcriptional regulator